MISARILSILAMGGLMGAAVLMACSDDEVDPNPERSSSSGSSGTSGSSGSSGTSGTSGSSGTSGTSGTSGGEDSGPALVNACRTFEDRTATDAVREIPWDNTPVNIATRPDRCMQVKVGQKVVWKLADPDTFSIHPVAVKGGDTPNPISGIDTNGEVTFTAAGTFGYQCGVHLSAMAGAVLVVP